MNKSKIMKYIDTVLILFSIVFLGIFLNAFTNPMECSIQNFNASCNQFGATVSAILVFGCYSLLYLFLIYDENEVIKK